MPCISKAEKHRRAGTLDEFRARQTASRASAAAAAKRHAQTPDEPTLEERVAQLELTLARVIAQQLRDSKEST